jgi:hypothetical protein
MPHYSKPKKGKQLFLALLILASLVPLAETGMLMSGHHVMDNGPCPIAASQGENCPMESDSLEYAIFHLTAFHSMMQAEPVLLVVLSVLAEAFCVALFLAAGGIFNASNAIAAAQRRGKRPPTPRESADIDWLNLFVRPSPVAV